MKSWSTFMGQMQTWNETEELFTKTSMCFTLIFLSFSHHFNRSNFTQNYGIQVRFKDLVRFLMNFQHLEIKYFSRKHLEIKYFSRDHVITLNLSLFIYEFPVL